MKKKNIVVLSVVLALVVVIIAVFAIWSGSRSDSEKVAAIGKECGVDVAQTPRGDNALHFSFTKWGDEDGSTDDLAKAECLVSKIPGKGAQGEISKHQYVYTWRLPSNGDLPSYFYNYEVSMVPAYKAM